MKKILPSDKELLRQIAQNNSVAFEILFKQYYSTLAKMLMRYSCDPEQVKDWTQEIYVSLWKKRGSINIDDIENVKGYFIVLARNHVLRELGRKKQVKLVFGNEAEMVDIADNNLQEGLDHNELWKAYLAAITKLPPRTREVFYLNREKGMTYTNVAERLGISVKTVEVQISRALTVLRRELIGYSVNG